MRLFPALALLCCLTGAAHAAPASAPVTPHKAYLSLIIDDLGQNLPRDRRVLALPGPVTTAVMPDTPHAAEFARADQTDCNAFARRDPFGAAEHGGGDNIGKGRCAQRRGDRPSQEIPSDGRRNRCSALPPAPRRSESPIPCRYLLDTRESRSKVQP